MPTGMLFAALLLAANLTIPDLNDGTYVRWREYLRPTAAETKCETVPWRTSYWEGVLEGQRSEKPVLLWAMNGHPLACT